MDGLVGIIETVFVGAATIPWLLVIVDLLSRGNGNRSPIWSSPSGWLPGKSDTSSAGAGFLLLAAAFFLGSGVFVMADEFFNLAWPGVRADSQIRIDSYAYFRAQVGASQYPPALQSQVAKLDSYARARGNLEKQIQEAKMRDDREAGRKLRAQLRNLDVPGGAIKDIYDHQKFASLSDPQGAWLLEDVKQQLTVLRGGAWNLLMLFLVCLYASLSRFRSPILRAVGLLIIVGVSATFLVTFAEKPQLLASLGVPFAAAGFAGCYAILRRPASVWRGYWAVCLASALVILAIVPGYVEKEEEYCKSVVMFYRAKNPLLDPVRLESAGPLNTAVSNMPKSEEVN